MEESSKVTQATDEDRETPLSRQEFEEHLLEELRRLNRTMERILDRMSGGAI